MAPSDYSPQHPTPPLKHPLADAFQRAQFNHIARLLGVEPKVRWEITAQDRRFLASLRIASE